MLDPQVRDLADALAQKCAGCGLPLSTSDVEYDAELCSLCALADRLERASDAAIDEQLLRETEPIEDPTFPEDFHSEGIMLIEPSVYSW